MTKNVNGTELIKSIFNGSCTPLKKKDIKDVRTAVENVPGSEFVFIQEVDASSVMTTDFFCSDTAMRVTETGNLNKTRFSLPETTDYIKLRQELTRANNSFEEGVIDKNLTVCEIFYTLQAILEDNMSLELARSGLRKMIPCAGRFTISIKGSFKDHNDAVFHCCAFDTDESIEYVFTYELCVHKNPAISMEIKAVD